MRTYPRNSSHAAARIVALAVLADGHLAAAELDALEKRGARRQLGLESPAEFREVIHALCEDLLSTAERHRQGGACRVDRQALATLMSEIEDPGLRTRVLELCVAAIEADDHVADGEALVIAAALEHWQFQGAPIRAHAGVRGKASA